MANRPRSKLLGRGSRARRAGSFLPPLPVLEQRHLDVIGLGLVALAAFLAFVFYLGWNGGSVGEAVADALVSLFGAVAYLAPIALFGAGALLVVGPMLPSARPFRAGALCVVTALCLGLAAESFGLGPDYPPRGGRFMEPEFFRSHGGSVGEVLFWTASTLFQPIGAHILFVFLLLAGILLLTGASVASVLRATGEGVSGATRRLRQSTGEFASGLPRRPRGAASAAPPGEPTEPLPPSHAEEERGRGPAAGSAWLRPRGVAAGNNAAETMGGEEPSTEGPTTEPIVRATHVEAPPLDGAELYPDVYDPVGRGGAAPAAMGSDAEPPPDLADGAIGRPPDGGPEEPAPGDLTPQGRLRSSITEADDFAYELPPAGSLKRSNGQAKVDSRAEERVGRQLVEALGHFGMEAALVGTVAGPHVTRYELRLAPGTKMSRVAQLKDDLAYALAATDVRILAPIPGKQAVGVEVPNADRRLVHLGDVFQEAPSGWSPLTVWLGKDIAGKAIGTDLAKQPHVLIAGTTGSGKSGCINAMLSSVLLRATPNEVKLVLVDPKQVELNLYESIPHLITPVVTSPRLAANVLGNLIKEMEERYSIMSLARTRSLGELNRLRSESGERPLPHILCVIDELADLMMVAPGEVEDSIIRLAQKSRAVGIHLVLATQRPSADIITGMIKANVPARIAFAVSSQTDSRVILDQNGAESLLGHGDMLFRPASTSRPARIQGAFTSEEEVEGLTAFWRGQGEPALQEELLEAVEPEEEEGDDFDADSDDLLAEAVATVVQMGTASTSMLQRRLRVGYTRAGRLIDMMERRGVISGYEGSKARQVLVSEADLPRVLAALDDAVGV